MSNDIKARIAAAKAAKVEADNAALAASARADGFHPLAECDGALDILRGVLVPNEAGRLVTALGSVKAGDAIGHYRLCVVGESEHRDLFVSVASPILIGPDASSKDATTVSAVNGRTVACEEHGTVWARKINGKYRIGCQNCATASGNRSGKKAKAARKSGEVQVLVPGWPAEVMDAVKAIGVEVTAIYNDAVEAGLSDEDALVEELVDEAIARIRAVVDAA